MHFKLYILNILLASKLGPQMVAVNNMIKRIIKNSKLEF